MKDLFEEYIELELLKINDRYWALNDRDSDTQIGMEGDYSYIGLPYKVKYLGGIKIPTRYFEAWAKRNAMD